MGVGVCLYVDLVSTMTHCSPCFFALRVCRKTQKKKKKERNIYLDNKMYLFDRYFILFLCLINSEITADPRGVNKKLYEYINKG